MINKVISHFKILEKLGEGGMGVVYKAHDTVLDRSVALKFLPSHLIQDEESKIRLKNEAKAASSLDHPNICTIHEIGEHEGQPYIAFALVEGDTLEVRLSAGPLPLGQAIEIAKQISKGLSVAHEKSIVHRDLKPANIMIDKHGIVKIMDFGLARRTGATKVTKTGSTLGTLAYMSPEQVRGEEIDGRADLWSLGAILIEMVTGEKPFQADYDASLMYEILNEAPKGLSTIHEISSPLFKIVDGLLERDVRNRITSASELNRRLNKIEVSRVSLVERKTATRLVTKSKDSLTTRVVREIRRRRLLPYLGSYLVLSIGLLQAVSYPYLITICS
ncbi:hypothetical protein BVY01_01175, partial [bacterium I07]